MPSAVIDSGAMRALMSPSFSVAPLAELPRLGLVQACVAVGIAAAAVAGSIGSACATGSVPAVDRALVCSAAWRSRSMRSDSSRRMRCVPVPAGRLAFRGQRCAPRPVAQVVGSFDAHRRCHAVGEQRRRSGARRGWQRTRGSVRRVGWRRSSRQRRQLVDRVAHAADRLLPLIAAPMSRLRDWGVELDARPSWR